MSSYCLSWDKAWHSLKNKCTQHSPKPKVLIYSSPAVSQLFLHTSEHYGAPVKYIACKH
jgi:hypothetical protein